MHELTSTVLKYWLIKNVIKISWNFGTIFLRRKIATTFLGVEKKRRSLVGRFTLSSPPLSSPYCQLDRVVKGFGKRQNVTCLNIKQQQAAQIS
jgi:hypothetical protein